MKRFFTAVLCTLLLFCTAGPACAASSDPAKYSHAIDMNLLADYMYGGSKSLSGALCDNKKSLPTEWRMHKCPSSLPIVAKAILHVGDAGKLDNVKVSFYPGTPSEDYHQKRLNDLSAIGYAPTEINGQGRGEANTAFYCMATSEFDVVAYNEKWVAVWSEGSLDTSRGMGGNLCATYLTKYGSWKSGVYFIPRQYCYLLDINNQIGYKPELQGMGKATAPLMVKTTPDSADYVKSGVYKINQTFPIVNIVPQNGHYQIYYQNGLYYVEAQYVNLQCTGVKKPPVIYIAEVSSAAPIQSSASGETVAEAKSGASIDVLEKDLGNGYTKIWFNSQECYTKTDCLTNFQATPQASGLAQLGAPIGTLVMDSPYADSGQEVYSAEELALLQQTNYGHVSDWDLMQAYIKLTDNATKLWPSEWVNVYKIEKMKVGSNPKFSATVAGKIYTVVYNGTVGYIVQPNSQREAFTYYAGNGYSKQTVANTQELYVDSEKYSALAYNIEGNNYFKLRDIAKMFDDTVKCFDITYDS